VTHPRPPDPSSQPPASPSPWRVSIDTGGTFTDWVALDPQGRQHHAKVLSSSAPRGAVEAQIDPVRIRVSVSWLTAEAAEDAPARPRPGPRSKRLAFKITSPDDPYHGDAQLLQDAFPRTEVVTLPEGYGHIVPQVHRQEFFSAIRGFLPRDADASPLDILPEGR
jgi:hypothetical protein